LALLLPKPDQITKNKHTHIRPDFGLVSSTHFYEAIDKWQDILFMGGFEKKNDEAPAIAEDDTFKDDNYEQNWGDRIKKYNAQKRKIKDINTEDGKVAKKATGKAKVDDLPVRRGRPRK
jgi:hypothetical protein